MKQEKKCKNYKPQIPEHSCANAFEIKRNDIPDDYDNLCDDCLMVCEECGSHNVEHLVWADVNTDVVLDPNSDGVYAPNCQDCDNEEGAECWLVSLKEFDLKSK